MANSMLQNKNLSDFIKETERCIWIHKNLRRLILFEQLRLLTARKKEHI